MNKFIVLIRHKEDSSIKSAVVVDSPSQTLADIKAFVKSNPTSAFGVSPEDWIVQVYNVSFADLKDKTDKKMNFVYNTSMEVVLDIRKGSKK